MSLATRCPACGTTFRVVRDQLRISEGWVRCGRCSNVFDGAAQLQDALAIAPAPAVSAGIDSFSDALQRLQADGPPAAEPAAVAALPPTEELAEDPVEDLVEPEAPPPFEWPSLEVAAPEEADRAAPIAMPMPLLDLNIDRAAEAPPAHPGPAEDHWSQLPSLGLDPAPASSATDSAQDGVRHDPIFEPRAQSHVGPPDADRSARTTLADDEVAAMVFTVSESGVRETPATLPPVRAARSGWLGSALRVFALLLLLLLLAAQVLYQQRNTLVAHKPALRPIFASVCERLGCRLSALQRIADISIDGASFARDRSGEGYQFSFTLRNRAAIPLAMPAVELSLLDIQERTVVRRVLRPADYGAPSELAAHGERATLLPIMLAGEEASSASRVAGFRLDAFYP